MKRAFLLTLALVSALFVVGNAAAAELKVDDDHAQCANAAYTTIQSAVNAAAPGDTVKVCAGTYTEEVTIDGKDKLKLESAMPLAATIKAPLAFVNDPQAIVFIRNSTDVRVKGFVISGPFTTTGCPGEHYGVYVGGNGSATIEKNHITEIRNANVALRGCQDGVAVRIGSQFHGDVASGTVRENTIDLYQKGGVVVDGMNSFATVEKNEITGTVTNIIAPNGIQISRGAVGKAKENDVSYNQYLGNPANGNGTGILLFEAGAGSEVANNDVFLNDDGVSLYTTTGTKIKDNKSHENTIYDGFFASSDSTGNVFENNKAFGNAEHDCHDDSVGTGTAGTGNTWKGDKGTTQTPAGICKP